MRWRILWGAASGRAPRAAGLEVGPPCGPVRPLACPSQQAVRAVAYHVLLTLSMSLPTTTISSLMSALRVAVTPGYASTVRTIFSPRKLRISILFLAPVMATLIGK